MKFLSDLLRTSSYRAYFRQNSTGLGTGTAGFLRLYDDKFLETRVYLPSLPEQTDIVTYLDKATADIDAAIDRVRRQIDLIREYRTRLIADVVTGKLDVRDAAAALPEIDPLEAEDEPDDIPDPGGGGRRTRRHIRGNRGMTTDRPVERPSAYGAGWCGGDPHDCDREHCVDHARRSEAEEIYPFRA